MESLKERHSKSSSADSDGPSANAHANRDSHARNKTTVSSIADGIRSSPPDAATTSAQPADRSKASTDSSAAKSDSEAETIVLPGKNGHSPSKVRKTIKHEERSDEEVDARDRSDVEMNHTRGDAKSLMSRKGSDGTASMLGKRKRAKHENLKDEAYAGNSSGLSSVPTSPVTTTRSSLSKLADSDSDTPKSPSSPRRTTERVKSSDRPPHKRRSLHDGSDDDERRSTHRQRSSGPDPAEREKLKARRAQTVPHREPSISNKRSVSPRSRHRRSVSTHLATATTNSANGLGQKKKKIPAPLRSTRDRHSTDYHSDDSSASGSPHPRSSRVRSLATPAAESAISPAKMPPHKKHRDNIGRTFLARAVAGGDLSLVKMRLEERPEDIDLADNAGNTPLQIAALEGSEDIVKYLIDEGCDVHCVNNDKDTPLLDAVENGHLEVVKLLLDAGVNPRRGNVNGEEPLDLVDEDQDEADEIKRVLIAARKKNSSEARRHSEDHANHDNNDGRSSHGTGSPRHSPPMQPPLPSASRRAASGRSTKTSNHILYMPLDSKTLRAAAGKGDEETVIRILQVRDGLDDPESLVAAAKGGHDNVINLLLGLGGANPDPAPLKSMPSDVATPMLAAIGRENLDVIKLLLGQGGFDATRRLEGETYYEIARRRAGPRWREEEEVLKDAYQAQIKKKKSGPSKASPLTKRDPEREPKKSLKGENGSSTSTAHKRKLSDERRFDTSKKSISNETKAERSKPISSTRLDDTQSTVKRGPGRPKKEDRTSSALASDDESAPLGPPKSTAKPKRADSDLNSENETHKPRRKLISGRDLKGEREKQRRTSVTSTTSTASLKDRERSNAREGHNSDLPRSAVPRSSSDPEFANDKSLDRARKLKRDDSRNRLSAIRGESPAKRPRSRTPPRSESQDSTHRKNEEVSVQAKRRRLDSDQKSKLSPDQKTVSDKRASTSEKLAKDRDVSMTDTHSAEHSERPMKSKDLSKSKDHRGSGDVASVSKASRKDEIERKHTDSKKAENESRREGKHAEHKSGTDKDAARDAAKEARLQEKRQGEVRVKKEPEDDDKKRRREDEEKKRRKDDEERRRRKDQEEERKRVEEEKRARIAREEKAREEEEKRKEEAERRRKEEAEKRRQEEAREAQRKEEEAKRQLEEEKRQKEEAEAQEKKLKEEAEARQREEEERRRLYLEQQRIKTEEMERRREQRIREQRIEQQRIMREREEARLAKLPPLLRLFAQHPQPASPEFASKFCRLQGVRYDTISPDRTGAPDGKDQWLLNTQVALLLGEKDLGLARYTAWPRLPASDLAKRIIWRAEADRYSLTSSELRDFSESGRLSFREAEKLKEESLPLFLALDLFFVKLSDFMYIVPNFPHVKDLQMVVEYRELPPDPSFLNKWTFPPKWKQDPGTDANARFAPTPKTYMNGSLIRESQQPTVLASKKPFPEHRVPRRAFAQVFPDDPEYEQLCIEQGLSHLVTNSTTPPNGTSTVMHNGNGLVKPHTNGMSPPDSDISMNDDNCSPNVRPKSEDAHVLSNGINGVW